MVENFFCSRIMNSIEKNAFLSLPTLKTFEEKKNQKKEKKTSTASIGYFLFFSCITSCTFFFLALFPFFFYSSVLYYYFFSSAHGRFVQPPLFSFHPSRYRLVSSFIFPYPRLPLFLTLSPYLSVSFSKSYVI